MKALYVHIPFCEKICSYCDYCKRIPKDESMIWDYLKTLKEEYKKVEGPFTTIYIGGGTPSMLNNEQLKFLLTIFKDQNPTEYTIEVNPESYTKEKGEIFKNFKINRISLGVQTFNQKHLKTLRRAHTNEQVYQAIDSLNNLGLNNISIDLMFALPGQTINDLLNDLNIIKTLNIKHLSYYELFIEENTIFYHQYKKGILSLIDSDLQREMYETIINYLKEIGMHQYEVSNYAISENFESLHNKIYWTLYPYDAIGAGSHGFNGKDRYYHSSNISEYIKDPKIIKESQSIDKLYSDYLIFGLRMTKGISLNKTKELFNKNPLDDFKELNYFINSGLLEITNNYLKPTLKGIFLLNKILEVFVWTI